MTAATSTQRRELAQRTGDAIEVSLGDARHHRGPMRRREPVRHRAARRGGGGARVGEQRSPGAAAARPGAGPAMRVAPDSSGSRRIDEDLERHRTALTRHCARMLGSRSDAEDAVQETLLRAWRNQGGFEGRSALHSWLHRIATNVCIDMLGGRSRTAVPVDPALLYISPVHAGADADPAEKTLTREAFRLALQTAIEQLPPQQRVVVLLREVMSWKATEVAELLGISRAAVNSSLQRARTTLHLNATGADHGTSRVAEHRSEKLVASYLAALQT